MSNQDLTKLLLEVHLEADITDQEIIDEVTVTKGDKKDSQMTRQELSQWYLTSLLPLTKLYWLQLLNYKGECRGTLERTIILRD